MVIGWEKIGAALIALAAATGCSVHASGVDHGTTTTTDPTLAETSPDAFVCTTIVSHGTSEHLAEVTLPAGTIKLGPSLDADIVADASSIGIQGDSLFTCANTVVRIGLADGKAEMTDVQCDAVTADATNIWVAMDNKLSRFSDFASVKSHSPLSSVALDEHNANRLAPAADGSLLAAAFQLDKLLHLSPTTGSATDSIKLTGYGGTSLGLSAAGTDRVVVAPWYLDGGLFVFDAKTGALTQALPRPATGEFFHGLSCHQP